MEEKYEEIDHEVSALYEVKKRIGKGAYGIVWEAAEKKTKKSVAVKKIFDAFRNRTDAMRTYREVLFMKEFQFHPNIIHLIDIFKAENNLDVYLVMERMDADLHSVIEDNLLKPVHKRFIMYQLLCAAECLSTFNVIHRDLKPSNVLLNANCHVRVADFGLARCTIGNSGSRPLTEQHQEDAPMTDYVATRWYRAPEILLADQTYTCGVDMWSIGCILGEMLHGKPLFPGSSTVNQIELIVESVHLPQLKDIELSSQYAKTILEKANSRPKRPLANRFVQGNDTDSEAIDLLTSLLVFQPHQRLSAQQALCHAYVSKFGPSDKDSWPSNSRPFVVDEDNNLSVDDYRRRLYQLIECKIGDMQPAAVTEKYDVKINDNDSPKETFDSPSKRKPIANQVQSVSGNKRLSVPPPTEVHSSIEKKVESPPVNKKNYTSSWFPAAGLPSTHPRSTLSHAQLRYHCSTTTTTTSSNSTTNSNTFSSPSRHPLSTGSNVNFSPLHKMTSSSSHSSTARVRCGRRQFGNLSNVSSLGSPKIQMQSYAQDHGTITASSLQQLQLGL